jgi:hypothetical protein
MPDTQALIGHGMTFEYADAATPTSFTYLAEIYDITPPSSTIDQLDVTHMQSPDRNREFIPGLSDPGEFSFEMNYVPGSTSDASLRAAKGKRKWCRVTFPNGRQLLFFASLQTYEPAAPTDDKMTASVSFKVSGNPQLTDATAPRNITAPSHAAAAVVGVPLVVDPGVWAGSTSVTYQWTAAAADITGATGSTYVPVTADVGDVIACEVTAANGAFSTTVTTTATTATTAS